MLLAAGVVATTAAVAAAGGSDTAGTFALVVLLEAALSVDTVVALLLVFGYFAVPAPARTRLLGWAMGATAALRLAAVPIGDAALDRLDWLAYPLAGLLVVTTLALVRTGPGDIQPRPPETNRVLATVARVIPLTNQYDGVRLRTATTAGRRWTPMVLVAGTVIALAAVLALDGIAAGRAVTHDPALVAAATILAVAAVGSIHHFAEERTTRLINLKAALSLLLLFAAVRLTATGPDQPHLGASLAAVGIAVMVGLIARSRPTDDTRPAADPSPTARSATP
ncbi:MAG: hypothetical protein AB1679_01150 [Actinomycetota bacterium]